MMEWFEPDDQYFEESCGLFGPFSVGIEDERKFVKDSKKPPLSAVCRLRGPDNLIGTGVSVGPYAVLTAAHNFLHGESTKWKIDPAFNRQPITDERNGVQSIAHPNWDAGQNPYFDIGIIRTSAPLPAWIRPMPWTKTSVHENIYVIGYDADERVSQLYDTGEFKSFKGSMIAHNCDTEKGQSGAPVFARGTKGHMLLAIHVGGYWDYSNIIPGTVNKAIFFRPQVFNWVRQMIIATEGK